MSQGIPYADIVILALVAGFIILRLRSVLGTKSDDDEMRISKKMSMSSYMQPADPIVQLDVKHARPKASDLPDPLMDGVKDEAMLSTLGAIKALDTEFTLTDFAEGARRAFEMVFDAFIKGDKPTLKMLLSDELYQTFCKEIDARQSDVHQETTLVSVTFKELAQASLDKQTARLGIGFVSEQVSVERSAQGEVVGGDASLITEVDDMWVFERDLTSKSPNWRIIET
jgi:predicted lipid-binding transport protein (Tim44 family)